MFTGTGVGVAHHLHAVNLLFLHVPGVAFKWFYYAAFQSQFLKWTKRLSPSRISNSIGVERQQSSVFEENL